MSIDVTVIIPAYNHVAYVVECVESVTRQPVGWNVEIIVIDDGSVDGTAEALKPFKDAGEIQYYYQENRGQSHARNFGLGKAKGEFVAFLDDDDIRADGSISSQLEYLRAHPECVAIGGAVLSIDEAGQVTDNWTRPARSFEFSSIFGECPFLSPGQTVIRREALELVGGLNSELWGTDDWDLWFKLASRGTVIRNEVPSLHYRVHESNASRNSARMARNALRVIDQHLPSLPVDERAAARRDAMRWTYAQFARRAFRLGLSRLIRGHFVELAGLAALLPYAQFRLSASFHER